MKIDEIVRSNDVEDELVKYFRKYWNYVSTNCISDYFEKKYLAHNGAENEFKYFHHINLVKPSEMPHQMEFISKLIVENAGASFFNKNFPKRANIISIEHSDISSLKNIPKKLEKLIIVNSNLTSIDSDIECEVLHLSNNKIASVQGIHKKIKLYNYGLIDIGNNPITGPIIDILKIPGLKRLVIRMAEPGSKLSDFDEAIGIIEPFVGKGSSGIIKAQQALIDNDLEDYA